MRLNMFRLKMGNILAVPRPYVSCRYAKHVKISTSALLAKKINTKTRKPVGNKIRDKTQ